MPALMLSRLRSKTTLVDSFLLCDIDTVKLFRNSRNIHLSQLICEFYDETTTLKTLHIVLKALKIVTARMLRYFVIQV